MIDRRKLLAGGAGAAAWAAAPAWARGKNLKAHGHALRPGFDEVRGPVVDLTVAAGRYSVGGRSGHAVAVNGSVPGPLLRFKEGENAVLRVRNLLKEDTSIHWHGLLLPFQYDGVPGLSFPGIRPGETFTYEFKVRQAGSYWWHSHSHMQEQMGHYGPLIIDPAGPDPVAADRDYILLLSEFTPLHPHAIMAKLKKSEGYFNFQQTSWTDDYRLSGRQRRMWANMRMMSTDIADVTASTYTYLANGRAPEESLEFLFRRGERVRLRVINGSAMTFFNLRIPGLAMTVVAADGQNVRPVEIDELQIGVAETYDLLIEPGAAEAYAIVAESMDRSGMAAAMLASAPGVRAPLPALRAPPVLTMADMGMNHGEMGHGADHETGMQGMSMRDTSLLPPDVKIGPGIDMVSMAPIEKWEDPGVGLRDVAHRALSYAKLAALEPNPDARTPSRLLEIHLTGNMERYMWSFDGQKYSAVSDQPIRFAYNERVRVKLVNDTMMAHPIHLHGHFFELVNGAELGHQPRKHTVIVQPGASVTFDLTANEPGDWAFHCHLLYHMHAGMMQTVTVAFPEAVA